MKQFTILLFSLAFAATEIANAQAPVTSASPIVQPRPKPKVVRPARVRVSPAPQVVSPAPVPAAKTRNAAGIQKSLPNSHINYAQALQRYRGERHHRTWWKQRYTTIVLVGGGYYYWDAGYWFPALGYDPAYDYYDYNGPIYTYGNLLPDQVIINVQRVLKELGYYGGGLTGSLGQATRQAIANYQQDAGLAITAAIDAPTVAALGLG